MRSNRGKMQEKRILSIRDDMEVDEINKITNKVFMQYKNKYINTIFDLATKNKIPLEAKWIYINEREYQSNRR